MKILQAVLAGLDGISLCELNELVGQDLFVDLLKRACMVHPFGSINKELKQLLHVSRSTAPNNNPELFASAVTILNQTPGGDIQYHLDLLQFHLGQVELSQICADNGKFLRTSGSLFKLIEDVWIPQDKVKIQVEQWNVYLPCNGLFNDLFDLKVYPSTSDTLDYNRTCGLLRAARSDLQRYSDELLREIDRAVQVIALTWQNGSPSFSFRLGYSGGIFVNPFWESGYGLAEAILHEYCHQRLWQWWHYSPLFQVGIEDWQVTSPVTGNRRSIFALLQATLIYAECISFYIHKIQCNPSNVKWILKRVDNLRQKLPLLIERVKLEIDGHARGLLFLKIVERSMKDIQE